LKARVRVAFRKGEFLTANVDQSEFGIWLGRRRLGLDGLTQTVSGFRQVVLANSQRPRYRLAPTRVSGRVATASISLRAASS